MPQGIVLLTMHRPMCEKWLKEIGTWTLGCPKTVLKGATGSGKSYNCIQTSAMILQGGCTIKAPAPTWHMNHERLKARQARTECGNRTHGEIDEHLKEPLKEAFVSGHSFHPPPIQTRS